MGAMNKILPRPRFNKHFIKLSLKFILTGFYLSYSQSYDSISLKIIMQAYFTVSEHKNKFITKACKLDFLI